MEACSSTIVDAEVVSGTVVGALGTEASDENATSMVAAGIDDEEGSARTVD